jgi:prepilin-type processing-associated H-X9-DG protein
MNDQPSPAPPASPATSPSPKTSGLAIASLVLGILGITCILPIIGPILAIVLGIIALREINKSQGTLTGHGKAVGGLVLGCIGVLLVPVIVLAILLPPLGAARELSCEAVCFSNVRRIGLACQMYADDYSGSLPQSIDLLTNYVDSSKPFICPSAKDRTHFSYELTGVTQKWGGTNDVVLLEVEPRHRGRRTVLYGDGRVELQKN